MALLGTQLVVTLVMISIIQKLGQHYSFARWLLCSTGLVRYLYPTNAELKQLANIPKDKAKVKKGKHQANGHQPETFHVPRNLNLELETALVTRQDVIHLRYYTEYQWLLDFAVYAAIVYIITEIYHSLITAREEVNLSMMWCSLVLIFALRVLLSLTVQYFKGEESIGERSMCIVMGFAYFLFSMMILIIDENTLEIGLETAYKSFNESASTFLNKQGLNSTGPASKIVLKFFLALWCGILGALFTFPGLRIAKMHWDLLKYFRESKIKKILLNISFALPFILVIAWIKPVTREYLTVRIFSGFVAPLISMSAFETARLLAIIFMVIFKILIMPWYLQAYLDMAYNRVEEQKKEAGRITNIDLQKKIAAVFYYLCVVTLQYLAPLIICLYFAFMYKTLGEYSWNGLHKETEPSECSAKVHSSILIDDNTEGSITKSAQEFHLALENLKSVFTVDVYRGLFGFATWWSCFLYFSTTSIGLIYQSYFSNN